MSANHACSGPMPHKPIEHAATAPVADLKVEKVSSGDLGVPMDENDRQEAAADNQQELQKHESKDDMGDSQQLQTRQDAAAMDGPVLVAHVPETADDVAPIIKVCLSQFSFVEELHVHVACFEIPALRSHAHL